MKQTRGSSVNYGADPSLTRGLLPQRGRGMWWLSPAGAVCLLTLPTLLLAARTSDARYRFAWGTPKALTSGTVTLILCGAAAFVLAASVPLLSRRTEVPPDWPSFTPAQNHLLVRAAGPLFWLTVTGYLAFGLSGLRNGLSPHRVLDALAGQNVYSGGIRASLGKIPGITTLTQIGMAFVVVAMLVLVQHPDARIRRHLILILVLALLRASIVAERLAILELVIPAAAVLALRQLSAGRPRGRRAALLAPVILIPMVLVLFGALEYSRSWVFYRTRTSISYPQFVIERFAGYYATAYNNGQLALTYESYPGRAPYDSIEALWTFPGASLFGGYPTGNGVDPPTQYQHILALHGNPEFNSAGGLVTPFVDWGTIGGLLFLAIVGGIVGWLYRRCVDGHVFAAVVFPSMTTGLFELPRYIYWTLGRYAPSLLALCLLGYLMDRSGRREKMAAASPSHNGNMS